MFQLALPPHAVLTVHTASGGVQQLIHLGDGVFVSELPPLMFHGKVPAGESVPLRGLPVSWNAKPHGDREILETVFVFDAAGAMDAVKVAAEHGDTAAQAVVERITAGAKMLQAREAMASNATTDTTQ
jgi:hypothetical protein